eukprot:TRINITY_DN94751_c0_g1_i1.p1 TRINITY_DN94751_c0_g1~~TRINITY_DN94751_c0_g1_i1.p1  ORF type:complete len:299 (+),score=19.73 TRINITY_DN94751_c0_g1_i1:27-899(+)
MGVNEIVDLVPENNLKGFRDIRILSLQELQELWEWAFSYAADKRVEDWFLMRTPWPTLFITIFYLISVPLGCAYMRRRNAIVVPPIVLALYNFLLVIYSLYLHLGFYWETKKAGMSWYCNSVDYTEEGNGLLLIMYLYYLSKGLEFCDTYLMVIRKKFDQVTILHLWHHAVMWTVWWIGVRFAGGGDGWFGAWLNAGVHVIMYAYYGLAALKVPVPTIIKKNITRMQLTQFLIVLVHCILALWNQCVYPHWMYECLVFFLGTLLTLFGNFYIQAYIKKRRLGAGTQKKAA